MWWPAIPLVTQWQEGHNSAAGTRSGEKWGLADGEVGGPFGLQTFVLIANSSPTLGQAPPCAIAFASSAGHFAWYFVRHFA